MAGTADRYGVRYGRTTRVKVSAIEKDLRSRQTCPFCTKKTVKRVASGIWNCNNCKAKFTGAAYKIKREIKNEAVTNG